MSVEKKLNKLVFLCRYKHSCESDTVFLIYINKQESDYICVTVFNCLPINPYQYLKKYLFYVKSIKKTKVWVVEYLFITDVNHYIYQKLNVSDFHLSLSHEGTSLRSPLSGIYTPCRPSLGLLSCSHPSSSSMGQKWWSWKKIKERAGDWIRGRWEGKLGFVFMFWKCT